MESEICSLWKYTLFGEGKRLSVTRCVKGSIFHQAAITNFIHVTYFLYALTSDITCRYQVQFYIHMVHVFIQKKKGMLAFDQTEALVGSLWSDPVVGASALAAVEVLDIQEGPVCSRQQKLRLQRCLVHHMHM